MKKFLSKLALLLTCSAMALGVGVAAFRGEYKEAKAIKNCIPFVTNNTTIAGTGSKSLTNGGVTLSFSNISNSSVSNIQNAKDSTITSSEVPGPISSVKIYDIAHTGKDQDGSFTIYAGTASNAINNEIVTFTEYDKNTIVTQDFEFSGSYTFFKIVNSNARVLLCSKIEVYYMDDRVIDHMEIDGSSTQPTEFYENDEFSYTGLKVNVVYDDDSKDLLTAGVDYTVSSPDLSSAGNKTVTISAKNGGKAEGAADITYDITVNSARTLDGVTLSGDLTKKRYIIGEDWDLSGINVTANWSTGDELLGTLNSLYTAGDIVYTLSPAKPVLGGSTLTISEIIYDGGVYGYADGADYPIGGVKVLSSPVFEKYTDDFSVGKYVITASYTISTTPYDVAMTNSKNGSRIANTSYTEEDNIIDANNNIIWDIESSSDYYTIYNESANKYVAATSGDKDADLVDNANSNSAKWIVIKNQDGTFDFKNVEYKDVGSCYLRNSTTFGFGRYGSGTGSSLTLYKQLQPEITASVIYNKTTLGKGDKATIETHLLHGATGNPSFVSSDNSVLTVSANGDGTALVTSVAAGNASVTVSLLGCDDFVIDFTVVNVALLDTISVNTQPTKINYIAGESLDLTGLDIKVTYSDGTYVIKDSGFIASDVDMSTKGVKTVTISYTEDNIEEITRTTTFEIVVAYQSLTVDEAIDIIKPLEKQTPTAETYRVSGKIVDLEWNGNSAEGYANINIAAKYNEQDPEKIFFIYHALQGDKDTYLDLLVGANIVIESTLQKYTKNNVDIYETTANPVIISFDTEVEKLVTGISIQHEPDNKQYYVDDSTFNYNGLRIRVFYNDGTNTTVNYTDNVEPFLDMFEITDPNTSVAKAYVPVTVTHKATGFYNSFNVSVSDVKVSSIIVTTNPTKTEYASGETFDPAGIVVTAHNNNGSEFVVTDPEKLTYKTQSGDGKVYEGDTYVTVVYDNNNNITKTIPITVADKYIVNITASLSEGWNDDTYDIGSSFSTKSLVIRVNYSDGTEDKYNSKTGFALFTITPPDMSTAGDKDVNIALKGTTHTTTVQIHIMGVEDLSIDTLPYRTTYRVGDALDFTGLELVALYSDSHLEDVNPTWDNVTITGNTSKDGPQQTIIFTYKGKSASYKIDVWLTDEGLAALVEAQLTAIRNSVDQDLYTETNWQAVQAIISDLESTLNSFDAREEGQHYTSDVMGYVNLAKEEIAKIPVKSLHSITVSGPSKTNYVVGDTLDLTGLVVTAHFDDGSSKALTSNQYAVETENVDMSVAGTKTITVSFGGKSTTFTVTVNAAPVTLVSIEIKTNPNKTTYTTGEELDTTGLVLIATYSDQSTKEITSGFSTSGYNKNVTGTQTITVTFNGKTATFQVTVNEGQSQPGKTLDSITVSGPDKTSYLVGDSLDTTGLVVTAHFSDGTTLVVTSYTLSTFDSSSTGTKTITVTFEGKTATFEVVVRTEQEQAVEDAKVIAIAEYMDYFDSIDLSGYSEEAIAAFMAAKAQALEAINNATTAEEVEQALANARAALDKVIADNPKAPVAPSYNLGLIIGLSVGGAVLLAGGAVLAIILIKRKRLTAE